jgi:hypothetical protein
MRPSNSRQDDFFREAREPSQLPSEATLRQRMDDPAPEFHRVVSWSVVEFLIKAEVPLTCLSSGHIAVDIDGFALDNSGTHSCVLPSWCSIIPARGDLSRRLR